MREPVRADTRREFVRGGPMRKFVETLTLSVLAAAVVAEAAKPIRGRVRGGNGYVIVGTSAAGEGVTQTLGTTGTFKLNFPGSAARGATLQLIGPTGRYFGP